MKSILSSEKRFYYKMLFILSSMYQIDYTNRQSRTKYLMYKLWNCINCIQNKINVSVQQIAIDNNNKILSDIRNQNENKIYWFECWCCHYHDLHTLTFMLRNATKLCWDIIVCLLSGEGWRRGRRGILSNNTPKLRRSTPAKLP